eukprot:475562_1
MKKLKIAGGSVIKSMKGELKQSDKIKTISMDCKPVSKPNDIVTKQERKQDDNEEKKEAKDNDYNNDNDKQMEELNIHEIMHIIRSNQSGNYKLFTHLQSKLDIKEMNDVISANSHNNLHTYSNAKIYDTLRPKSHDPRAYEQCIVFGYVHRQQNTFDITYNDVFHNISMDITFICALYYPRIELNELDEEE